MSPPDRGSRYALRTVEQPIAGHTPTTASDQAPGSRPASIGDWIRALGPTGPLALIWTAGPPLGSIALFAYMNTIGTWLRSHEVEGLILYTVCFIALTGVALLPTYASAILGGWAFGFAWGFPGAMIGFLGGASVGYFIARLVASDRIDHLIHTDRRWTAVRDALVGSGFLKSTLIISLVRLPPNSPFALTNLVMASIKAPYSAFIAGTALGMAPRTALVLYLAVQLRDKMASEAWKSGTPWWWIPVAMAIGLTVLGILALIARAALNHVTSTPANQQQSPSTEAAP